jgi:hypothetical protein
MLHSEPFVGLMDEVRFYNRSSTDLVSSITVSTSLSVKERL